MLLGHSMALIDIVWYNIRMKSLQESLEIAQNDAGYLLVADLLDSERNIPMRATSHTDLWPGDRWAEAYLAIDEPQIAESVMRTAVRSIRPDGSVPHLMQGSHIRGGIETRWIDRQIYRLQGNGALKLPNGEWVTKGYGMPTLALGALALAERGLSYPSPEILHNSITALYEARANDQGLIVARKVDELTNSSGKLSNKLHEEGKVIDPAVNALAALNFDALKTLDPTAPNISTADSTRRSLLDSLDTIRNYRPLEGEEVLAIARLGYELTEEELEGVCASPEGIEHPERTHLTMAECLEIARLTPESEASKSYLQRILPKIAALGAAGITRFEGAQPGSNAAANKYGRKQIWLPTAAELVQIKSI